MKAGSKPEFLKNRVAYFVPGAEEWKYVASLDAITPSRQKFYLSSGGDGAKDVFRSGELKENAPGEEKPDHFVYDPLDTRPAALEQKDVPAYITDQTHALNLFGDGLIYHSEAFDSATEITGYIKLTVWLAMDVPDTDLVAELDEIKPDGTSVQLTSDIERARYRDSLTEEKLVKAGEINRYEFKGFTFFSRRIEKGSRLRLLFVCPNSIQLEKNYNSGGVVAQESAKDARTAHITLYHDAGHESFLEIPMVR
jgi:putative CocE/NonD family hydrolase